MNPVVDGLWGEWETSSCTKSCGAGEQVRIRFCDDPQPLNGGKECTGEHLQTIPCNTADCPQSKITSHVD